MPSHVLTIARLWGPTTSTSCLLPPKRCVSPYPQSRGRRCPRAPTQDFGHFWTSGTATVNLHPALQTALVRATLLADKSKSLGDLFRRAWRTRQSQPTRLLSLSSKEAQQLAIAECGLLVYFYLVGALNSA
eukprot:scaffold654116_cov57-Prasinocladus_malaysianus.AAC.1